MTSSTDTVGSYLDDIGAVPLLRPDEEVDLAKRMWAGRAAAEILAAGSHDAGTRVRLRRIVRDGRGAQARLAEANLRLVVSVARRYQGSGLDLIDLIQEGNIGLMRAVERFDHRQGYRFSTYATWWIRQSVTRGISKRSRTIRLPGRVHTAIGRIRRAESELAAELGHQPSDAAVAGQAGVSVERLRELRQVMRTPVALDAPVGDEDGGTTLGDLFPDESADDPEEHAADELTREQLRTEMQRLAPRDRGILERRFGLAGHEPQTLKSIGEAYGVTRERVRQLETRSLERLQASKRLAGLVREPA